MGLKIPPGVGPRPARCELLAPGGAAGPPPHPQTEPLRGRAPGSPIPSRGGWRQGPTGAAGPEPPSAVRSSPPEPGPAGRMLLPAGPKMPGWALLPGWEELRPGGALAALAPGLADVAGRPSAHLGMVRAREQLCPGTSCSAAHRSPDRLGRPYPELGVEQRQGLTWPLSPRAEIGVRREPVIKSL